MQILVTSYDFSRHFIYQHMISNLVGMNETLLKYGKKCQVATCYFYNIRLKILFSWKSKTLLI